MTYWRMSHTVTPWTHWKSRHYVAMLTTLPSSDVDAAAAVAVSSVRRRSHQLTLQYGDCGCLFWNLIRCCKMCCTSCFCVCVFVCLRGRVSSGLIRVNWSKCVSVDLWRFVLEFKSKPLRKSGRKLVDKANNYKLYIHSSISLAT